MNLIYSLLAFILLTANLYPQSFRETRAVWVSTNFRLDWPPPTFDENKQKEELIKIFDDLKRRNFNTVYFQVRSNGVVLYNSTYEPFSPHYTGETGRMPSYDPLAFAVELAHKRGMELHAWVNVIRCFSGTELNIFENPLHVSKRYPGWVIPYKEYGKTSYWIDAGIPEARNYLINVISEISERYDVDGIQLDFIRYPGKDFKDDNSYSLYGSGEDIHDWRRSNINKVVEGIYNQIKKNKSYIKYGAAPIGIYENIPGATGNQSKVDLYQDSREWLRSGYMDYIVPQVYWDIAENPKFDKLAEYWGANSEGRNVVLGIAAYKPEVIPDVPEMIRLSRRVGTAGVAFFRYKFINDLDLSLFSEKVYPEAMPWIDDRKPELDILLSYNDLKDNFYSIKWKVNPPAFNDSVTYFPMYKINGSGTNVNDAELYELLDPVKDEITIGFNKPSQIEYNFYLKAVDKLWNESEKRSNIITITVNELKDFTERVKPVENPFLFKGANGEVLLFFFSGTDDKLIITTGNEEINKSVTRGRNLIELSSITGGTDIKLKFEKSGKSHSLTIK